MQKLIFIFAVIAAFLATGSVSAAASAPEVVSVRIGAHDDFDRLVVELSEEAGYELDRSAEGAVVRVEGALADPTLHHGTRKVSVFRVREITGSAGESLVRLEVDPGATVKKYVYRDPYRIVIDFYPSPSEAPATPPSIQEATPPAAAREDRPEPVEEKAGHKAEAGAPRGHETGVETAGAEPSEKAQAPVHDDHARLHEEGKDHSGAHGRKDHSETHATHDSIEDDHDGHHQGEGESAPAPAPVHGGLEVSELTGGKGASLGDLAHEAEASADGALDVSFNDGWRWFYRRAVTSRLREEVYTGAGHETMVLASALGTTPEALEERARTLAASLGKAGRKAEADYLYALLALNDDIRSVEAAEEAAVLMRTTGVEGPARRAGLFLLASHYDRRGFFPEAEGYYSMLMEKPDDGPDTAMKAAVFRMGLLGFFEEKYNKAKLWFARARRVGMEGSELWLADTLLIKGQVDTAWKTYYRESVTIEDPVTLMSFADACVEKGAYGWARRVFTILLSRYPEDELLTTWFKVRLADTHLAEGETGEAEMMYRKLKATLESGAGQPGGEPGEAWAVSALAFADVMAARGGMVDTDEASSIYSAVAGAGLTGAPAAYIELARALWRGERYEESLTALQTFSSEYPTSPLRDMADDIKSDVAHEWLTGLFEDGDYYGMVKVVDRFAFTIPFGKKARAYLKLGMAYRELGLYGDAANSLKLAIRLGSEEVAEEAIPVLAEVYLEQGDPRAVEKLYETFRTKFSASDLPEDAMRVFLKAAYLNGDYRGAAGDFTSLDDPESLLLRAKALYRLERYAEAEGLFGKAGSAFAGAGMTAMTAEARAGLGDTHFMRGRYARAAGEYEGALTAYEEAGEENGVRGWALYRLGQSYARLGRVEESRAALERLETSGAGLTEWAGPIAEANLLSN